MDFFNSRYFLWNKNMQILVGVWPYQNRIMAYAMRFIFQFPLIINTAMQIVCFFKYVHIDLIRTILAILFCFYLIGDSLKMIIVISANKKLSKVYESLARNYNRFKDEQEKKILEHHFEIGRILTLGYVAYMTMAMIGFVTLPFCAYLIEKVIFKNNTKLYILDLEYFIENKDDYYYTVYAFEIFLASMPVPIFCSVDSTYAVCIQHCIGLLDIVKLRLQLATKDADKGVAINSQNDKSTHNLVIRAVKLHQEAYKFYISLETTYSSGFLIYMGMSILGLSVGTLVIIDSLSNPYEGTRYVMVLIGLMIHLFYISYPGQSLIDHSSGILFDAYNNEWYNCSPKTQMLLLLLMRKSLKPFQLTAGGMYVMNFQNLAKLIKCSLSYCTVFISLRRE